MFTIRYENAFGVARGEPNDGSLALAFGGEKGLATVRTMLRVPPEIGQEVVRRLEGTPIDLSKVDWELLRRQKQWLFLYAGANIPKKERIHAEGLLALLDHLMDEAARTLGEKVVFGK